MSKSKLSVYLIITSFVISFSSFQYGYGLSELNAAEFFIPYYTNGNYYNNTETFSHHGNNKTCDNLHAFFKGCIPLKTEFFWSLCVSIFAIGGLVGAFSGGILSSFVGRKWGLLVATIISALSYSVKSVFSNFYSLFFGRLLYGVAAGIGTSIAPMFLVEIAPLKFRGMFGTVHQVMVVFGILVSQVASIFCYEGQYWRILLSWPIILSTFQFFYLLLFCVESPQYLVQLSKEEKAKKVLMKLRGTKDVENELDIFIRECKKKEYKTVNSKEVTLKFGFGRYTYHFLLACSIITIQQFSGVNAITFYSTKVFATIFPSTGKLPAILSSISVGLNFLAVDISKKLTLTS